MPAGIIVVVTKTWNGTEFARNIPCTQNVQCLYGVVRTNWSIDTMQQHSKEAAELFSPLSTQMENMQNNTEGEYFWYLCYVS